MAIFHSYAINYQKVEFTMVPGLHHGIEQFGAAAVFHGDAFRRHRPLHPAAGLALCLRLQTRSAVADDPGGV